MLFYYNYFITAINFYKYKIVKEGEYVIIEDLIYIIVPIIVHILEGIGIFIITVAALQSFYLYVKNGLNPNNNMIKIKFAQAIALALEFKLASEILKTVIIKNMEEIYVLGAIIAIRVVLTFVIHWEIKADESHD